MIEGLHWEIDLSLRFTFINPLRADGAPGAQVLVKRQLSPPVMAAALRIRPVLFLAGERARGTALCIRHRSFAAGQGFAAPSQVRAIGRAPPHITVNVRLDRVSGTAAAPRAAARRVDWHWRCAAHRCGQRRGGENARAAPPPMPSHGAPGPAVSAERAPISHLRWRQVGVRAAATEAPRAQRRPPD